MALRVTKVLGSTIDAEHNAVIGLEGPEGREYALAIPMGVVGKVALTLVGWANKAQERGLPNAPAFDPMTVTGAHIAVGPEGNPALALELEGALPVLLELPQSALADLRSQLAKLADLTGQQDGSTH